MIAVVTSSTSDAQDKREIVLVASGVHARVIARPASSRGGRSHDAAPVRARYRSGFLSTSSIQLTTSAWNPMPSFSTASS